MKNKAKQFMILSICLIALSTNLNGHVRAESVEELEATQIPEETLENKSNTSVSADLSSDQDQERNSSVTTQQDQEEALPLEKTNSVETNQVQVNSLSTKANKKEWGITTTSIYVRPYPNAKTSLGIIGQGEKIYGSRNGSWFQFQYQGQEAYVAEALVDEYVDESNPIRVDVRVNEKTETYETTSSIYVRPEKNSSQYLGILPAATVIEGIDEGAWLRFNYEGQKAYIAKGLTTRISKAQTPVEDKKVEESKVENSKVEGASEYEAEVAVYIRPEKNSSQSLGILNQGEKIQGVEDGAWIRFDYQGQKAYVAKDLMKKTQTDLMQAYTTSSLYVRPEKNSTKSLGIIGKNEPVEGYLDGAWFAFTFEGQKAYIASNFLAFEESKLAENNKQDETEKQPISEERSIDLGPTETLVTTVSLYVRPDKQSNQSLGILPTGAVIEGSKDGAWFRFIYEGQEAYVAYGLLRDELHAELPSVLDTKLASADIYIRPLPSSSESLGILTKNEKIQGIQEGAWFHFMYEGQDAYVANALLRDVDTVFIDPGHGGTDPGALSKAGVHEKDLNLQVSLKLRDLLEAEGLEVIMAREDDSSVGLYERAIMSNDNDDVDIFVSVHHNASADPSARGLETYFYEHTGWTARYNKEMQTDPIRLEKSEALANSVQKNLVNSTGMYNRGVKSYNFAVLRESRVPAILAELGFLTNPSEAYRVTQSDFQYRLAQGLAQGIIEYFNEY